MSARKPILAHPEDIHCVIYHLLVLAGYVIAFLIYHHPERAGIHGPWSLTAFVAAASMMLGWISGVDIGINFHNHAHRSIFTSPFLARWFGRLWTFSGGWPSYLWRYAHVVVHHANLLHPERDWTVAKRRADGTVENLYIYMFLHWPWRYSRELWREFARATPERRREAIKETAIFLVLWSIPFWIDVKMALLLWVLPHWVANVWAMGPGMWVQHEGCVEIDGAQPHSHSNDHLSPAFNATTFNIGYHIEHHEYPNVHWSELPALHLRMREELIATGAHLQPVGYYGASARAYRNAVLPAPPVPSAASPETR
jgi:beta-carotene hydroxylase